MRYERGDALAGVEGFVVSSPLGMNSLVSQHSRQQVCCCRGPSFRQRDSKPEPRLSDCPSTALTCSAPDTTSPFCTAHDVSGAYSPPRCKLNQLSKQYKDILNPLLSVLLFTPRLH
eukprot:Selendium_serpulae@DN5988_c1_g1_i5.p1